MPAVKKNKQKMIHSTTRPGTAPLLLPRNEREAKKLAEANAIIEKMIFLPDDNKKN